MHDVFETLSLLTPWDINVPKVRIGSRGDGGYVVADNLRSDQSIISLGVGDETSFDVELAKAGFHVWQFDHTVPHTPVVHPNITFTREGIAGTDQPEKALYTIDTHAKRHDIALDGAILKMDVEGAEWDVLEHIPVHTLEKFDQILIELHGLGRIARPKFAPRFRAVLKKLNAAFTLFHVHANNARPLVSVDSFVTPALLEVSLIRTDLITRKPSQTWYPTALDAANVVNRPDLRLWLYPFAPRSKEAVTDA